MEVEMNRTARQEMINGWDQKIIREAKILVVGAGTTGNEIIKNLALLGVGNINIIDCDKVEEVNLSRSVLFQGEDIDQPKAETAAKRALKINPHIQVSGRTCDVVHDIGNLEYSNFNCVILAVDNLEARMWVNRYCWLNQILLIDTGIDSLLGNVFVMAPPLGSCLECGWYMADYRRLSEKYSCLKIGLVSEEPKIPMVITTAAVIAGIATQECVRLLHEKKSESVSRTGILYWYSSEQNTILKSIKIDKKEECPGHDHVFEELKILPIDLEITTKVEEIKNKVATAIDADVVELWHDKEIVYSAVCNECSCTQEIAPIPLGKFKRLKCPSCNNQSLVPKDFTAEIRSGFAPTELNIPHNHLVRVVFSSQDSIREAWLILR
ncbi:MAG: ThiF family adenylyltransferase [Oscillatoriales cyanobacterium]|nr:MAG: ThiF family adenylyltransferase [Oscillatoriales cyanobacterium]TAG96263.1 MAG: ThiF family adenylyltransferase [Oscillatoriales cyanobacterium]